MKTLIIISLFICTVSFGQSYHLGQGRVHIDSAWIPPPSGQYHESEDYETIIDGRVFFKEGFSDWPLDYDGLSQTKLQQFWGYTADMQSTDPAMYDSVTTVNIVNFDGTRCIMNIYPEGECCFASDNFTSGTAMHAVIDIPEHTRVALSWNFYTEEGFTNAVGLKGLGVVNENSSLVGGLARTVFVNYAGNDLSVAYYSYNYDHSFVGTNAKDFEFTNGQWHNVTMIADVGTINNYDGFMKIFIDDVYIDQGGHSPVKYLATGHTYGWNKLSYQLNMGGDGPAWNADHTEHNYVDDIVVYTPNPADYAGSTLLNRPVDCNWPKTY
jgi:hypothetical protein